MDRKDHGEDMSLFVKNVENVQGDERDFIIFSTTFGRNSAGLFRRNFGALGQAGGERRLNVAVTRARRKVIVVGSMPIKEISDLLATRRHPQVPRDYLQAYLQYSKLMSDGHLEEARRLSERLLTRQQAVGFKEPEEDAFKNSVADHVRDLGHEPIPTADDPILGVDFSIRDPRTGRFGVGIECDPPNHRLTRRARAREIWRQAVLLRAYPVIHRVSISAWYNAPQKERDRLGTCLAEAIHVNSGARA
jgi:primosomal replication protein N''